MAAAIALYLLYADNEPSAEVYPEGQVVLKKDICAMPSGKILPASLVIQ